MYRAVARLPECAAGQQISGPGAILGMQEFMWVSMVVLWPVRTQMEGTGGSWAAQSRGDPGCSVPALLPLHGAAPDEATWASQSGASGVAFPLFMVEKVKKKQELN